MIVWEETSISHLVAAFLILAGLAEPAPQPYGADDPRLTGYPSTTRNPSAPCTCGTAQGMSGWCERHGVGYVADVRIRSWILYETMDAHGHAIGVTPLPCPDCQKALESDGFCEADRVGFVERKAYFSRLTYELARAQSTDPSKIACSVCRKNARGHGWCEIHQMGMVNNLAIRDKQRYQAAAKAIEILEIASTTSQRCEHCAMAIVTDGRCPFHRINYKDGHPL